jgi:hypothetical protein
MGDFHVMGFVVNIHDPVNYDIDFMDPDHSIYKKYWNVLVNPYIYTDYELDEGGKMKPKDVAAQELSSVTYRCRLKGVGMKDTNKDADRSLMREAFVDISRLIDTWEGWVLCTLKEVDKHSRLLVELENPQGTGEKCADLFFTEKYKSVFYVFH